MASLGIAAPARPSTPAVARPAAARSAARAAIRAQRPAGRSGRSSVRHPSRFFPSSSFSSSSSSAARRPLPPPSAHVWDLAEWRSLSAHASSSLPPLRELLSDASRTDALTKSHDGVTIDFSRQNATEETLRLLCALCSAAEVPSKVAAMFGGAKINSTEGRSVLHVALRAKRDDVYLSDGADVVPEVYSVLDRIEAFSAEVRSGARVGATGRRLTTTVAIGIGGSYLGPEFAHVAFRRDAEASRAAAGRELRFLANVDPTDAAQALAGLDPETTLVVVVSKTFTTTETMLNARTARAWIARALGEDAVAKHVVAVSTNLEAVERFGIDPANAFGFWDWVGGRYSVTSAVGVLPLALQYGFPVARAFLDGARSMDEHFLSAPPEANLPTLLALFSAWNSTFLGRPTYAILPYAQALARFPAHVQQVSMESLGKGVALNGARLPFEAGEVVFGEPGTNGQHSFYQLVHQGRVVPAEFVGALRSQTPVALRGEPVSNHEELMANFFAQPDALALGKTPEELRAEGVPEPLVPHKTFEGNRPSLSILLPDLSPRSVGKLLALYEHRVAAQGFLWDINAFDQWGVELGKALATKVRTTIHARNATGKGEGEYVPSTARMLDAFFKAQEEDRAKARENASNDKDTLPF